MVGKRYVSRRRPTASFTVGMGHEGVKMRPRVGVIPAVIPGANRHQIDPVDFKREWVRVGVMLGAYWVQVIRLLISLCRVAACGTKRGRFIRVTSFQAEVVLLLVVAWVITMICYVIVIVL